MLNMIFFVCFAANFGLAFYLVANEKSQAQPWRFFVAALISILLTYGATVGADAISASKTAAQVSVGLLGHIEKLMNLISGAFSGALASVAITNRAKFMYDKSVEELKEGMSRNDQETRELIFHLREQLENNPSDPGDQALLQVKVQTINRVLSKLEDRREEFNKQAGVLGVKFKD